jgi:cell division transport system ATP-binding protein
VTSIVRFENVGLRYGTGAEVLRDLSFGLESGSLHVLLGASGAGKTSLLKLLYLAQLPTRGRLTLFGSEVGETDRNARPALRRRIGVVFQDFRLVPHLSTFDNVALPLRLAGAPESDVRDNVEEMLKWVDLSARRDARPATLSGGEQQRVAIARAVIGRPQLLVADEPTGNVDSDMSARLLHLFQELNKLGTTIVIATHDVNLAFGLAGAKQLRLERGSLVDPTGALRHPPQPFRSLKAQP